MIWVLQAASLQLRAENPTVAVVTQQQAGSLLYSQRREYGP